MHEQRRQMSSNAKMVIFRWTNFLPHTSYSCLVCVYMFPITSNISILYILFHKAPVTSSTVTNLPRRRIRRMWVPTVGSFGFAHDGVLGLWRIPWLWGHATLVHILWRTCYPSTSVVGDLLAGYIHVGCEERVTREPGCGHMLTVHLDCGGHATRGPELWWHVTLVPGLRGHVCREPRLWGHVSRVPGLCGTCYLGTWVVSTCYSDVGTCFNGSWLVTNLLPGTWVVTTCYVGTLVVGDLLPGYLTCVSHVTRLPGLWGHITMVPCCWDILPGYLGCGDMLLAYLGCGDMLPWCMGCGGYVTSVVGHMLAVYMGCEELVIRLWACWPGSLGYGGPAARVHGLWAHVTRVPWLLGHVTRVPWLWGHVTRVPHKVHDLNRQCGR